MRGSPRRVALVELGRGHGEVLLPQVQFLLANDVEVWVITGRRIIQSGILEPVLGAVHTHEVSTAAGLARIRELFKVRRLLRVNRIPRLVFNTAEGKDVLRLAWMAGRDVTKFGIVHNPHKLLSSTTQRLISRKINRYLVIGERPCRERSLFPSNVRLDCFYPVYAVHPGEPRRTATELVICIPGNIEQKRRDYLGLVEQLRGKPELAGRVRFVLLGDASRGEGPEVDRRIERFGLRPVVTTFQGRVPQDVFLGWIRGADALMSLAHPGNRYFEMYRKYKVSGALQLALSFGKPLLMHEEHRQPGLEGVAIHYRWPAFLSELVTSVEPLRAACERVAEHYRHAEQFTFDYQAKRYMNLVFERDMAGASPA